MVRIERRNTQTLSVASILYFVHSLLLELGCNFHSICGSNARHRSSPYDFIICFQSALWAVRSPLPAPCSPLPATPSDAIFVWFRFRMLFVVEFRRFFLYYNAFSVRLFHFRKVFLCFEFKMKIKQRTLSTWCLKTQHHFYFVEAILRNIIKLFRSHK